MKNFLKLTNLILLSLFFLLILARSSYAQNSDNTKTSQYGEIKQKYYEKIVSKWGFKVIPKLFETTAISITDNSNPSDKEKDETITDDLIIVTESIVYEPINTIEVQTESNYNFIFFNSDQIPLKNYSTKDFGFRTLNEDENAKYYQFENEGKNTIAINSKYLISLKTLSNINTYFASFVHAQNFKDQSNSQKPIEIFYPDKVVLETFSYALILFLFAIISYKTAILINTHRKNSLSILQIESKNILEAILSWSEKISPYAYLCLIFLIGILIYLIILISLTNRGDVDMPYLQEKMSDLTKINLDVDVFKTRNPIYISILLLIRAIQVILFIILIPRIVDFSRRIYTLRNKFDIDNNFLKHTLIVFMLLTLLSVALMDIKTSFVLPLSLVSITILFLIPFVKTKLPSYTKKETFTYLGIGLAIFFFAISYKAYNNKNPKATVNDLFAADTKVIFLPYQKDIDGSHPTFIQKKIIKSETPIFVDNYLIFHPKYDSINHIELFDINKISKSGGIILHPQKSEKMYENLLKNEELRNFYVTNQTTNKIYFKNENADYIDRYSLLLEIECTEDINPQIINLSYMSKNNEDEKSKLKSTPIANFSGCSQGELNQTLEVSLEDELYENEYMFSIDGIDLKFIKNIKVITDGNTPDDIKFIDYNENEKFKIIEQKSGTSIFVLNIDKPKKLDLQSPIQTEEKGLNLSENINKLIQKGLLKDSFKVWSTEANTVIYNKLSN